MELNLKSTISTVIPLVVMVVLVSAVLIPVVSEAQTVSGTPVEYSNDFALAHEEYYNSPNKVEFESNGAQAIINGHTIGYDSQFRVLLAADTFYAIGNAGGGGVTIFRYEGDTPGRVNYSGNVSISCENGNYTVVSSLGTHTGTYTHVYAACAKENADTCTVRPTTLNDHYLPADYQLYFMSDVAQTGYMIYDGEPHVLSGVGTVTYTEGDLVEGTTDVILGSTMSIVYNDSEYNVAVVFVPLTVHGHADSGPTYTLVGIIPLLILAGMVIGVVGSFIRNRD